MQFRFQEQLLLYALVIIYLFKKLDLLAFARVERISIKTQNWFHKSSKLIPNVRFINYGKYKLSLQFWFF